MKPLRFLFVALLVPAIVAFLSPLAAAGQREAESITITIDRGDLPESIFHPGRFFQKAETVTVHDFVIRNYYGDPIEDFVIQTASGRTEIPIYAVEEIRLNNWIQKRSDNIAHIQNTVEADIFLTDGSKMNVIMNADWGKIEGKTDLGEFFLDNPYTVRRIVFNRAAAPAAKPKKIEKPVAAKTAPLDSDGDGVVDEKDLCPDTPMGVEVDENGCPLDSDGDGVPDYKDECPDTPAGAPVNDIGCWIIKGVHFEYDKWEIKPEYYGVMDENVRILQMNPTLEIEIQGHTDSIASDEYNQTLSEKRANAAMEHFVSKGVNPGRLQTRGFGESKPIASNETPEGRAKNRRIEIRIMSR